MARNTASKGLEKAAKNPRQTITLLVLAGIGIGGYKLYQNLFGKDKQDKARDAFDESVSKLPYKPSRFSHSEADLKLVTNNVFQAMNQYGTDEDTIIDNLEKLNKDEMYYVMAAFGMRLYSDGVEASNWITKNLASSKLNLIGWLKKELGGDDLEKVQAIFNKLNIPF